MLLFFLSGKEVPQKYSDISHLGYKPIYEGAFSNSIERDGELYLPITEILPLINAKIAIGEDGNLYINPNLTSLSQALYNTDIGALCFDANDDIVWDETVSIGGYITDTIFSFRFDRLDFIYNTGRVSDYEEIFKAYLIDDERYLSAYDMEHTPQDRALDLGKDIFDVTNTAFDSLEINKDFLDMLNLGKDVYPEAYDLLKNVSDEIEIDGPAIVKGAYKILDYWNAYSHQIDDHREMLSAVYTHNPADKRENTPSYRAALSIRSLYSEQYSGRLLAATSKTLRDFVVKDLSKKVMTGTLSGIKPYKLAFDITKLILPEEFKTIHADSLLYVMDAAVQKSYDTYIDRKYNGKFDTESLNNLRLCAIMALVSSKYAYKSLWDEGAKKEKIDAINEKLEKLYLAADGVECDSSDYYEGKQRTLKDQVKQLAFLGNSELSSSNPKPESNTGQEQSTTEGTSITEKEAIALVEARMGSDYSYSAEGFIEKDGKQYYAIKVSVYMGTHYTYAGVHFFVSMDGKEVRDGVKTATGYQIN